VRGSATSPNYETDTASSSETLISVYQTSRIFLAHVYQTKTASVVQWPEFLATDREVPGSIPGATGFFEK
jgi:hypothetical protein